MWLPAALAILLIAGESTQSFSIQHTSRWLYPFWARYFASLPFRRFWELNEALRKIGHLIGYGMICLAFFLTWKLWLTRHSSKTGAPLRNLAGGLALISVLLLGSADEIHQSYVPQRTSTVADMGIDVCGGYLALLLLFTVFHRKTRVEP